MPIPTTPKIPVIYCFDTVESMPVSTFERNSRAASDQRARQREARSQTCLGKNCGAAPSSAGPIKMRRTVAHTMRPLSVCNLQHSISACPQWSDAFRRVFPMPGIAREHPSGRPHRYRIAFRWRPILAPLDLVGSFLVETSNC